MTVEQVHNEFNTAADRLLDVYNERERKRIMSKADRLNAFGFTGCKDMHKAGQAYQADQLSALLEQYAMSHPTYKIIAKSDLQELCTKYNLVFGELWRFNGFVPDKNLQEIEKFFHKDYHTYILRCDRFGTTHEEEYYTEVAAKEAAKTLNTKEEKVSGRYAFVISEHYTVRRKADFIIAAPRKDMDIDETDTVVNGEIKAHVPDPVVLFPIENDCYLIVTAWGDEASDPIVVNEKMN